MAAYALQVLRKPNIEVLHEQLDLCNFITGKPRRVVENFLYSEGIYSLDEVDAEVKDTYQQYINAMLGLSDRQRKYYASILEQFILSYLITKNVELVDYVSTVITDRAIKNKVLLCLLEHGITDCREIDYDVRSDYEASLIKSGCTKLLEYVKAMDVLKLEAIHKDNISNPLKPKTLTYSGQKVFLLYHPDHELAMTFYYIRDKEELLFDFSLEGSAIVKSQVFKMLSYVLEEKKDWHDRRERFIIPLKKLYMFCIENGVDDIELLTAEQIDAFRLSMAGKVGTKTDTYMQIIYNITSKTLIQSGVKKLASKPPIDTKTVEYNGEYYAVGGSKLDIQKSKTENENTLILTMATIAEELKRIGKTSADIRLGVGLPLTRMGAEKQDYLDYMLRSRRLNFKYEGKGYSVYLLSVDVFPQGYAGVVSKLNTFGTSAVVVDIGSS